MDHDTIQTIVTMVTMEELLKTMINWWLKYDNFLKLIRYLNTKELLHYEPTLHIINLSVLASETFYYSPVGSRVRKEDNSIFNV